MRIFEPRAPSGTDLGRFALAGLLAATIAALAAWIPMRRAPLIDPTCALRAE